MYESHGVESASSKLLKLQWPTFLYISFFANLQGKRPLVSNPVIWMDENVACTTNLSSLFIFCLDTFLWYMGGAPSGWPRKCVAMANQSQKYFVQVQQHSPETAGRCAFMLHHHIVYTWPQSEKFFTASKHTGLCTFKQLGFRLVFTTHSSDSQKLRLSCEIFYEINHSSRNSIVDKSE
jgi:hypothetical protein